PADAFGLWRLPPRQAERFASEELRLWWLDHPRLSFAEYRRQQAMQARAARDERDLANGAAAGSRKQPPEPECPWQRVPGGAVKPVTVPVGTASVAGWAALDVSGATTVHPSRARAA